MWIPAFSGGNCVTIAAGSQPDSRRILQWMGRKVRAPKGGMPVNGRTPQGDGKWNRELNRRWLRQLDTGKGEKVDSLGSRRVVRLGAVRAHRGRGDTDGRLNPIRSKAK